MGKPPGQACDQAGFARMSVNEICTAAPEQSRDRKNATRIFVRANRMHEVRDDMRFQAQLAALFEEESVVPAGHDGLNAVAERTNQIENMNLRTPALALRD
jgi:hypothetical protein